MGEHARDHHRLTRARRRTMQTWILIGLTVLVSWMAFEKPRLLDRLTLWPPAIDRKHEYERLVTYGFVHADWMHLLFNMITLYFFGPLAERFYSRARRAARLSAVLLHGAGRFDPADLPAPPEGRRLSQPRRVGCGVGGALHLHAAGSRGARSCVFFLPMPAIVFGVLYLAYSAWADRRGHGNINHARISGARCTAWCSRCSPRPGLLADFVDKLAAALTLTRAECFPWYPGRWSRRWRRHGNREEGEEGGEEGRQEGCEEDRGQGRETAGRKARPPTQAVARKTATKKTPARKARKRPRRSRPRPRRPRRRRPRRRSVAKKPRRRRPPTGKAAKKRPRRKSAAKKVAPRRRSPAGRSPSGSPRRRPRRSGRPRRSLQSSAGRRSAAARSPPHHAGTGAGKHPRAARGQAGEGARNAAVAGDRRRTWRPRAANRASSRTKRATAPSAAARRNCARRAMRAAPAPSTATTRASGTVPWRMNDPAEIAARIRHDADAGRFTVVVDGVEAELDYRREGDPDHDPAHRRAGGDRRARHRRRTRARRARPCPRRGLEGPRRVFLCRTPGSASTPSTKASGHNARPLDGSRGNRVAGTGVRLNKYISDTGACSRREADRLIAEGRVQVNGLRARIGAEVGEGDRSWSTANPCAAHRRARASAGTSTSRSTSRSGITCTTESGGQGQHHRLRRPPGADLPDRAPGQGVRGPDPADQQRRHRQRDPARREQAGEGIPGRDQPPGHRRVPARHGPRACRCTGS